MNLSWELDREASKAIWGRVTGAQWADVDGDREPELLIASDWDSPRVFKNGTGEEITKSVGLAEFTGRWNCIAAADFDSLQRLVLGHAHDDELQSF